MPLYEYKCGSCAKEFEVYKRVSDDASAERCPVCGGDASRAGISLVGARPGNPGSPGGGASCGGGSRRSPFS